MNRDQQHRLERNELADRLGSGLSSIQSLLPLIVGALAILLVGSVGWGLYSASVQKKQAAAWTEYYFNLSGASPEDYEDLANGFPDSAMAGWARISAGDAYLNSGIENLYRNRKTATEKLELARDSYEEALEGADNDELKSKALLGLAHTHESMSDLEKAAEYYEQFSATSSQPQLVSSAQKRLEFINSETGKEFYAWFSKLDPKPDAPVDLPGNLGLPPTSPDIQFDPLETSAFSSDAGQTTGDGEAGGEKDLTGPPGTVAPETKPIDTTVLPPVDLEGSGSGTTEAGGEASEGAPASGAGSDK